MCETETGTESASLADLDPDLTRLFRNPNRTSQELVRAVFGLKQGEIRAYFALTAQPHISANHLADELDQHRRYAARSLRGLHDADLAEREQEILDTGGQGYVYDPVPVEQAQQYLHDQLNEWVAHLRAEIEALDSEIEAELACDGGSDDCSCAHEIGN